MRLKVRGQQFYLYLFEDWFSRKVVGWQVFDGESAELAGQLPQGICTRQGITSGQLTGHSDNGAPMKGETTLASMQRLGVAHMRRRWVTELAHRGKPSASPQRQRLCSAMPAWTGHCPKRALVHERARQENPRRWSGQPRGWAHVDVFHLNSQTPQIKEPQHMQKTA